MTAMHALAATEKHTARHAAEKATTRHLPTLRLPKRVAKPAKVTVRNAVTGATKRVTPTGQALYTVTPRGQVEQTLLARTVGGVATFAHSASSAIDAAYPNHWFVQLFETETQRKQRVNAQAVAHVLGLVGTIVAKRVG